MESNYIQKAEKGIDEQEREHNESIDKQEREHNESWEEEETKDSIGLEFITLENPVKFEDILKLWFDEKDVKNKLINALENNKIYLYARREDEFFKIPYSNSLLLYNTMESYQWGESKSDYQSPLFFNMDEIFSQFPSLNAQCNAKMVVPEKYIEAENGSIPATSSADSGNDVPPNSKIPVNVPPDIWTGKTPQAIFNILKEEYEHCLIALVIDDKCKTTKVSKGRPFLPDGSDDSVYRKKFNRLVRDGGSRYVLTFHK